ncbi:pimeloyl-ACP methyl ester carboxylesterase [Haloferula luteola]|uniref:Pimeloyl-ACP methyl ester carboxylesterase n=1 Tax=Haloferula luteola TaxID=595692 RepID=A0A840V6U8_9BACT|nr:alpha/beta hydrolase [Haloferula luteola]MBB5352766.1 pimeloyl-ACP methyl ester carboxylesterase [Haloferula luteola]
MKPALIAMGMLPLLTHAAEKPEGVILLHGLCRRAASMEKMARALNQAAYLVLNQEYPSRKDTIENLSESILPLALDHPKLADCEKIHFVTHSMGGLLVRSYFHRHTDARVGRVVMLGPPNRGSEVIDAIGHWWIVQKLNGPAGSELGTSPESTAHQLGELPFEVGVIAGDRSINWINSLMIHGPDDGKVSVANTRLESLQDHVIVHVSHPYLMKRPQVIELTQRFLRSGSFAESPAPDSTATSAR